MLLQGGFEFALPCRAIRGRLHPGADFPPSPRICGHGWGCMGREELPSWIMKKCWRPSDRTTDRIKASPSVSDVLSRWPKQSGRPSAGCVWGRTRCLNRERMVRSSINIGWSFSADFHPRERETELECGRERKTDRDRELEIEGERDKERQTQRGTDAVAEWETYTREERRDRQTESQRLRERDKERNTHRETEAVAEIEKDRGK